VIGRGGYGGHEGEPTFKVFEIDGLSHPLRLSWEGDTGKVGGVEGWGERG